MKQIVRAMGSPRWPFGCSRFPGKPHFSVFAFFQASECIKAGLHSTATQCELLLCVCFLSGLKSSPDARLTLSQRQRNCQKTCFLLGVQCLSAPSRLLPWPHHAPWDSGTAPVTVFLPSICETQCIDDIQCEDLPPLQKTVQALLSHLQQRRWAVNPHKIQGPGTTVKLLGVMVA